MSDKSLFDVVMEKARAEPYYGKVKEQAKQALRTDGEEGWPKAFRESYENLSVEDRFWRYTIWFDVIVLTEKE